MDISVFDLFLTWFCAEELYLMALISYFFSLLYYDEALRPWKAGISCLVLLLCLGEVKLRL